MVKIIFTWPKLWLSKNGLRIALGRLVKILENCFFDKSKQKWLLSKNGLRIVVARLANLLEKVFLRQAKKN